MDVLEIEVRAVAGDEAGIAVDRRDGRGEEKKEGAKKTAAKETRAKTASKKKTDGKKKTEKIDRQKEEKSLAKPAPKSVKKKGKAARKAKKAAQKAINESEPKVIHYTNLKTRSKRGGRLFVKDYGKKRNKR